MRNFWIQMGSFGALVLGSGNLATAFPAVGDQVTYEAPYQGQILFLEKEIIEQNPTGTEFRIRTRAGMGGMWLQEQEHVVQAAFLYTPDKVNDVLQNCEKREGAISLIELLGSRIKICEFYNEDSQLSTWIGMVPFGVLRFQEHLEGEKFLDFKVASFKLPPNHSDSER